MASGTTEQRKLAAIMFTDMVGYSALSQRKESLALELLEEHRLIVRSILPAHEGRAVKTPGDGFLIEFPSALAAVQCAVSIQHALYERNQAQPAERQIQIRIGIHVGDVVLRSGDIHGDGVNIAARLEPLAPAGGICVSNAVYEQVRNKLEQGFASLGPAELKNIELPVSVHRVVMPWEKGGSQRLPSSADPELGLRRKIGLVACGLVIVIAVFAWQPWRKPDGFESAGSRSPTKQAATIAAARQPLERAREIDAKWMNASRDELKLAITLCQGMVDRDPVDVEAWALLSRLTCNLYDNYDRTPERLDGAASAARTAVALAPEFVMAQLAQAGVYVMQQVTYGQGLEILRRLQGAAPDDPEVLVRLGWGLIQGTDELEEVASEGLKLFDNALALRPGDSMALEGKAWLLAYSGRSAEAHKIWNECIRRTGSPLALVGKFYELAVVSGKYEEAKAILTQFPSDLVFNDTAVRVVTHFWLSQREPVKALQFVEPFPREFVADKFDEIPKGYLVGKARAQAGQLAGAQAEWRRALDLVKGKLAINPANADLVDYRARLHYLLGEADEAARQAELFEQLTKVDSGLDTVRRLHLYMELGRSESAVSLIENNRKALAGTPAALRRLRDRLRRGLVVYPAIATSPEFQRELVKIEAEVEWAESGGASSQSAATVLPPERSIAVLAFANLSNDQANEYFSDGVSEELLNALARIPGLKVSARSSAFSFKGVNVPIPEIARKLGVAYVVEGSVRKASGRVRIAVRLTKAEDGFEIWSDKFDREVNDIFAVQEEIAALISKHLSLKLGMAPSLEKTSGSTTNLAAYEAFLKGRTAWNTKTPAGNREAVKHFTEALTLDSLYALAHGALAEAYVSLANDGDEPAETMFPLARASAMRALELDRNIVQAHTALAECEFHFAWNWSGSEEHLQRALAIDPNYATAYARHSGHLHCWGRHEEAVVATKRAAELDPLGRNIDPADSFIIARRYAEAIAAAQRSVLLDPRSRERRANLGLALFLSGQTNDGLKVLENLGNEPLDDNSVALGWAYGRAGRTPEANAILQQWLAKSESSFVSPLKLAKVAIGAGDNEFAFAQLEQAYAIRDPMLPQISMEPFYDPIREDPRFRDLLRRLKLDVYFP